MTAFEQQHAWRSTTTVCPRCTLQPGSHAWPKSWLQELTIVDGTQAVHSVLCRRPSCGFGEIIALRAVGRTASAQRRRWLREAFIQRPGTFVLAALVQGVAIGVLLALL